MGKKKETCREKAIRVLESIRHPPSALRHTAMPTRLVMVSNRPDAMFIMEENGVERLFHVGPTPIPRGVGDEPYLGYFLDALAYLGLLTHNEAWKARKDIERAEVRRAHKHRLEDLERSAKKLGYHLVLSKKRK